MKPARRVLLMICALALVVCAAACSKNPAVTTEEMTLPHFGPDAITQSSTEKAETKTTESETGRQTEAPTQPSRPETTTAPAETTTAAPVETTTAPLPTETEAPETTASAALVENVTNFVTEGTNGYVIVIDPGHQEKGNSEQEPVGPGASQTKAKVSSGTASRFNGTPEYLVNMQVALKLRTILLERGYTVIMTRTGNAVNISNVERAEIANNANADAFVRIHCNGSENASIHGIGIYYQTPSNPYNAALHGEAKALNGCMLRHMLALTGARDDGLVESDTYSGINWCQVPAGLVEMGYMTNEAEDAKLQDDDYQQLLALGMADGIDEFLSTRQPKN